MAGTSKRRSRRALCAIALFSSIGAAHAELTLDAFDPGASGGLGAMLALPDGRAIIGGTFATVGGVAHANLARVDANGALDATFAADADGSVAALVRQPDGKILVGGFFTTIAGVSRAHLARVDADGSLDTAFDPAVTGGNSTAVLGIALQSDGKILVAGQFDDVDGAAHANLVRLNADGSVDGAFATDIVGGVSVALPLADGRVVIGGNFIQVDSQNRAHIARLAADGSLDTSFHAFADGTVDAIAREADGHLLLGGSFGSPQLFMSRFDADGQVDSSFNLHFGGSRVRAIVIEPDGSVLVGGSFQSPRHNIARFSSDFTLDADFAFDVEGGGYQPVATIEQAGGVTLIGGEMTSVNGIARGHGARFRDDAIFGDGFD